MAVVMRRRSSGRQRLRQGYVGKNFTLDGRQYVVEDVIAEGGYAVVLDVRCTTGTNERLALKRVAVNNEHDLFLCRQEIAIMKALSDSNYSVTYLASQINRLSKEVYEVLILMQLYGGQSGLQLLRQYHTQGKQLPENLVLKIFTSVCQAVSRLHHRTKPIVHRDLKIENILQDFSGNFVLCDYGSCTTQEMNPTEMGASQCEEQLQKFTTLSYRAPEMVDLYSGCTITTKSDIWALGCLLYKLCFFDTPFGEQTLAIIRGTFSFPETATFYSNGLLNLIKYILNPNPNERPDIFQVSWVAYKLMGRDTPIVNVFNSPIPTILDIPIQLVKPKAVKSKSLYTPVTVASTSPVPNRSSTPQPNPPITFTSISSRERPRPRPFSVVGLPPSNKSPQLNTPSNHLSTASTATPSQSPQMKPRPLSQDITTTGIESSDNSSLTKPLPPPVTDLFGHVPFSEHDLFGAVPFSTTVKQVT